MDKAHVTLSDGTLHLRAQPVSGQAPASHGGKTIAIKYLSGAVNAKQRFTITAGGGFDFTGSFRASTDKGTWPAFWLTAVKGWPPEIDMAEWKGNGKISFNTFNASNQVAAKDINYPRPDLFHDIKTELRDKNGKDVEVKFHMDGQLMATQVGRGYVGQAFYL
jgi:beta-glucanase (GH16 family)